MMSVGVKEIQSSCVFCWQKGGEQCPERDARITYSLTALVLSQEQAKSP